MMFASGFDLREEAMMEKQRLFALDSFHFPPMLFRFWICCIPFWFDTLPSSLSLSHQNTVVHRRDHVQEFRVAPTSCNINDVCCCKNVVEARAEERRDGARETCSQAASTKTIEGAHFGESWRFSHNSAVNDSDRSRASAPNANGQRCERGVTDGSSSS